MKNKHTIFLLVAMIALMDCRPANAWLVAKISNMAEDVSTSITKVTKNAQKKLDQAASLTVIKKIGKGFKESKSWVEGNLKKVKDFSNKVQKQIDQQKEMIAKTKEVYQNNIGNYKTLYNDLNDLDDQRKEITESITQLRQDFEDQIEAQKSLYNGRIDGIKSNIENIKQLAKTKPEMSNEYMRQVENLEQQIKDEESSYQKLLSSSQNELNSQISKYNSQLTSLTSQMAKVKSDLMLIAGITEEEQSAEETLTQTANVYFLQYDEVENPQRQEDIRKNRLLERRRSIIDAYVEAIKYIPDMNGVNNETEDLSYNAATFDTTAGAWGAAANLQIQKIKSLSNLAHLMVVDLKKETAIEMADLTFYKLKKDQKNIANFRLDDYAFNQGDK